MPPTRHARLTALLAKIDQEIAEARELLADDSLPANDREHCAEYLEDLAGALEDVERKLRAE